MATDGGHTYGAARTGHGGQSPPLEAVVRTLRTSRDQTTAQLADVWLDITWLATGVDATLPTGVRSNEAGASVALVRPLSASGRRQGVRDAVTSAARVPAIRTDERKGWR